ncbi:MAG: GtrA family protein [Burkholderiales bacterium]|nr:GtrA family protein [Burkholderiales bacterium]
MDKARFLRFLVAGGINTLFGFAVYSASIAAGAEIWLALLVGMLAGTVFNFFTTGGYAFRQLSIRRWPRFVGCYLFLYGLNLVLAQWLTPLAGGPVQAQALLLAPLAILSYVMMARLVFTAHG